MLRPDGSEVEANCERFAPSIVQESSGSQQQDALRVFSALEVKSGLFAEEEDFSEVGNEADGGERSIYSGGDADRVSRCRKNRRRCSRRGRRFETCDPRSSHRLETQSHRVWGEGGKPPIGPSSHHAHVMQSRQVHSLQSREGSSVACKPPKAVWSHMYWQRHDRTTFRILITHG